MKVKLFGIYDVKTKAYMRPFPSLTKGEALRMFDDLVNDGKSMCAIHPEDFHLFVLGEFDDQTGNYLNYEPNESIISAMECVKEKVLPVIDEIAKKKNKQGGNK